MAWTPGRSAHREQREDEARATGKLTATVVVLLLATAPALAACADDDAGRAAIARAGTTTPTAGSEATAVARAQWRNGRIIHSDGKGWRGLGKPPKVTGPRPSFAWTAFEQRTGSFLYVSVGHWVDPVRVSVVGRGGPKWGFACDGPAVCENAIFGPGPDEVTARLIESPDRRFVQSLQVLASDGTARDRLDISEIVTDRPGNESDQVLAAAAWSLDGRRLAVGTEPASCHGRSPCEARVWIFERAGGRPRLVHTEPTPTELVEGQSPEVPVLPHLSWSQDGRSLGLLVAPRTSNCPTHKGVGPRLVALRFLPGRTVRSETLHAYDGCAWQAEGPDGLIASHYDIHFAFAWSPDGDRVAVTDRGGIAEISADDGQVLARHPGKAVHGPLAWLRRR